MTRNAWQARDAGAVDLTVRCGGKRVMQVLRGTPAPVLTSRAAQHSTDELVLDDRGLALAGLGAKPADDMPIEFTWLEAREINCPNHKVGHLVNSVKLWQAVLDVRQTGRNKNVEVRQVSQPYFDGSDPFA